MERMVWKGCIKSGCMAEYVRRCLNAGIPIEGMPADGVERWL